MSAGSTTLIDRTLWFDGCSEMTSDAAVNWILQSLPLDKLVVTLDEDVNLFNMLSDEEVKTEKTENLPFNFDWNIPDEFLKLELETFLRQKIAALGLSEDDRYEARLHNELVEISNRKLENLFKCLIYVVETFKSSNTVWGVGRGSSCASLALFLIGLHLVDPIKYNIGMHEFFHD